MSYLEIERKSQHDVVMKVEEEKGKINSKLDFENLSDGINYIVFLQKVQK